MAARKVQLKDNSGNKAYPVTSSACVGMSDGSGSLDEKISGIISNSGYVTCTAAAGTAAKTVNQANFMLSTNCRLIVKMANYNTVASPTLNVNNTGAKPLYYNGEIASADNTWEAGEVLDIYYDGTNYQASNVQGGAGAGGNQILEWTTDAATTRLQIAQRKRKEGMIISYNNPNTGWVNEQYIGSSLIDAEWKLDYNWQIITTDNYITRIGLENFESWRYIDENGIKREGRSSDEKVLNFYHVRKNIPITVYSVSYANRSVIAFYNYETEESFVESVKSYNTVNSESIAFIKAEYVPKQDGYIRVSGYCRDRTSVNDRDSLISVLIGDMSKGLDDINSYIENFTEVEEEGYDNISFPYNGNSYLLNNGIAIVGTGDEIINAKVIRVGKGFKITAYTTLLAGKDAFQFLSESKGLSCIYSVRQTVGGVTNVISYTAPDNGYILLAADKYQIINGADKGEHLGKKLPYIHVSKSSEGDEIEVDDDISLSQIDGAQDHSLPNLFNKSAIRTYDSEFADKVFAKIGRKTDSTGCYSNNIECKEGDWFTRSDFGTGIVVALDDSGNVLGDVANAAYNPTIQIIPSDPQKYDFSTARYVVFVVLLESLETEKIVKAKYMPNEEGDFITIPKLRVLQNNMDKDTVTYLKSNNGRYYQLQINDDGESPILSAVALEGIPDAELPRDFPTFKTTGNFSDYYDSLIFCPVEGGVSSYMYELSPTGLVKRYINAKVNCPRILREDGVWYYYGVNGLLNSSIGKLNIYKASGDTFQLVKGNLGDSQGQNIEPHDCLVLSVNPLHYICQRYVPNTNTVVSGETKVVTALHVEEIYEGTSVWEWHSEDYPELWVDSHVQGNNADYLHNNTICLDKDGNLCLNNKQANQILVIERTWNSINHTGTIGEILWKIGGNRTHSGWDVATRIKTTEKQQWYESHDAIVNNGLWTMYDNRTLYPSRILEFNVNTELKALENYKEYTWNQYRGLYMGSVDRVSNGIFLVSWGSQRSGNAANAGIYNFNTGKAIFEIRFDATGSSAYRVYGIKKGEL